MKRAGAAARMAMAVIAAAAIFAAAAPGRVSGGPAEEVTAAAAEGTLREKSPAGVRVNPDGATLETRFPTPKGYTRVPQEEGSLGAFLRAYPMKPDGSPILLYNGKEKGSDRHAAVFAMHLEDVNEQQCADTVMRLYAEYFRATGQEDRIRFHFVSGFLCDWNTFKSGYRVSVSGNNVSWVKKGGYDDSDAVFERYLTTVFAYASTLSMDEESRPITEDEIAIGDVFLRGGSPGHVCVIADMCEKDGKKAFLLAQGYMPAQEFHVLKNPDHPDDPWYYVDEITWPFRTPENTFAKGTLKHLVYAD